MCEELDGEMNSWVVHEWYEEWCDVLGLVPCKASANRSHEELKIRVIVDSGDELLYLVLDLIQREVGVGACLCRQCIGASL